MPEDPLGDRMKAYEGAEAQRQALPLLPVLARMDGRRFSRWTRDLRKPFDEEFHLAMCAVTSLLVSECSALIGYTQSDEITLVFHSDRYESGIFFDGRLQKMCSVLASMTTWKFNQHILGREAFDKVQGMALFDCRVWQVPNQAEAANAVLWRERDATRNSVLAAARSVYSHRQVLHRKLPELHEMLFQKGINWNDYPDWAKRGSFFQRKTVLSGFTDEEWLRIPVAHRPPRDHQVQRSVISRLDMPSFVKIANRVGVIFGAEEPRLGEDSAE